MTSTAEKVSPGSPSGEVGEWPLRLYSRSPLKQEKFKRISELLGDPTGLRCLDLGSDNGVVSLLLRRGGGSWASADLIPETVESIRALVETDVHQIDGRSTPFAAGEFDVVVVVDLLEHIATDRELIGELHRIVKPGGRVILNVPNPREGLLRKLRFALGQTDQAHGHLRPGYSVAELAALTAGKFEIVNQRSYSKLFSELIDTAITAALDLLKGKRGQKGTVVTGADLGKLQKSFKLYSAIYPIVAMFVWCDRLLPWMRGSMLIVEARRVG